MGQDRESSELEETDPWLLVEEVEIKPVAMVRRAERIRETVLICNRLDVGKRGL